MAKKFIFIFLILLLGSFGLIANASVTQTSEGGNISATISPTDPKPGDIVKISIQMFGIDLSKSYIIWYKDDKQFSAGVGMKEVSVQLGTLGSATKISAYVQAGGKYVASQSFYFTPADLVLDWQADTFTPPLYQGKPRAVSGSNLKIVATPYITNQQKQALKSEQLFFTWRKEGENPTKSSGLGKNIFITKTASTDKQLKIIVTATDPESKNGATKQLIINLEQPELGLFEKKPLEGVNYGKQIASNYELYGQEAVFKAVPFFWPLAQLANINYAWTVNNLPAQNEPGAPSLLTVRQPNNGAGVNIINLQTSSLLGDRANLTKKFNISFGFNLLKNNANN